MADLSGAFSLIDAALGQNGGGRGGDAAPTPQAQPAAPLVSPSPSLMGAPPLPASFQPRAAGPSMSVGPGAVPVDGPRPLDIRISPKSPAQDAMDQIDAVLAQPPMKNAAPDAGAAINNGRPPISPSDLPGDLAQSLGTGIEKGAIGLLGLPADAAHYAGQGMSLGMNYLREKAGLAPIPYDPNDPTDPSHYFGSAPITKALESVAGPMYQPQSVAGDYAQAIGEFIPGAGAGEISTGVRKAVEEAPTLLSKFTGGLGAAAVPATTNIIAPAVGSEAAGQMTQGTPYEGLARLAGGVAGGAAGFGGAAALEGAGALRSAVGRAAKPFTASGQDLAAGRTLRDAMATPDATMSSLAQPGELVPGSAPTSFQQSGDLGLGMLERQARNTPGRAQQFIDRDQQQNAARVDALNTIAPAGSPIDAANAFTAQKRALEAQHDAAIAGAQSTAADASNAVGGTGSIDSYGRAIGDALAPQYRDVQNAAREQVAGLGGDQPAAAYGSQIKRQIDPAYRASVNAARDRVEALGGQGPAHQRGAALRAPAQEAANAARDRLNALYDAVPSDVATNITALKRLARSFYADPEPAVLDTMTPREIGVAKAIAQYGNKVPFGSARAIDTMLTSAMREELSTPGRGRTVAYRRLAQLKDAWETSVHDGIAKRATADDAAVAAGDMAPGDTVANRIDEAVTAPSTGSRVYTPSGRGVDVGYRVVDAGSVNASHLPDGRPNPAYPSELQPRDRSRAASDTQIADIASNLQPERLGASSSAAEGAPIVGPDGHVESGNGRVLAIHRAYDQNGPAAQRYRDYLADQGYDTAGMARPLLIRQRETFLTPAERVRFAQEANASPVLSSSATERAATDASRLSDDALSQYQGGDVASAANRGFVRSFLRDTAEKGEQGSFAGPDGQLSLEGQRRIQNALLHAAYDDPGLVSALAETGDENIRGFGNVMQYTAGRMAQLRREIDAGRVDPSADLSGPMLEAARVVQRARQTGQRLADVVAQQDAFSPIGKDAQSLLQMAYGPDLSGRLSRAKMGEDLNAIIGELGQQTTEARLFGEPLSAEQVLEGATARYGTRQATGTSDRFARGSSGRGQGDGTSGPQGRGFGNGAGGSEGAAGSGSSWRGAPEGRPLTQADLDALNAAKGLTKENKATFGSGAVGDILKPGPTSGSSRMVDSAVPDAVFPRGPGGYEAVRSYRLGFKSDEQAIGALHDTAAASLRRAALREDGTLDPGKYEGWKRNYAEALRAVPELRDDFDTAAHAADTLDRFGTYGPDLAPSAVPDLFFGKGAKGGEGVRQLQSLVPDSTEANKTLAGYAAYSLRKAALKDDGTLDPGRYATWKKAHAEALAALPNSMGQQFDTAARAAVGLKRFGSYEPDLASSKIPDLFFHPGKAGADGVRLLRSLAGDDATTHLLGDYAAFSLRSRAVGQDGSFNVKAADAWLKAHAPALAALPPDVKARFTSATKAQQAVEDAMTAKATEVEAFNGTAAAKLVGATDPDEVVKKVGSILKQPTATSQMRSLAARAAGDPAALAGLKRAIADVVKAKALSVNEAGTSGTKQLLNRGFADFMRQNAPALREVLSPEEFGTMTRVGQDLSRAVRSTGDATKGLKAGPGTAQDMHGTLADAGAHGSIIGHAVSQLLVHGGSALAGWALGGPVGGMIGMVGSKTVEAARAAGMQRINDLVDRALLDPHFARAIVAKVPDEADKGTAASLRSQFARIGRATALGLAAGQTGRPGYAGQDAAVR